MSNKTLSEKDKQFTVLPNEKAPKTSFSTAHQAVTKALAEVKKTRKLKLSFK